MYKVVPGKMQPERQTITSTQITATNTASMFVRECNQLSAVDPQQNRSHDNAAVIPESNSHSSDYENNTLNIREGNELSATNPLRNRSNDNASVILESNSHSSDYENDTSNIPKCKKVTFSLDHAITIYEDSNADHQDQ